MFHRRLIGARVAFVAHIALACVACSGCAGSPPYRPPDPLPDDRRSIPRPAEQHVSIAGELAENQVTRQVAQMFDVARGARRIAGRPREAMNVDAFDEVPNSSWFTNRNHAVAMSVDEFRRGPNAGEGPDLGSPWKIFRAKSQGVTPGFSVVDGRGDRYLIKFDPLGHPESISGAEVVCTKLFYAAGYNTPENYVVEFDPALLEIGEGVVFADEHGKDRAMTREDIDVILSKVPKRADGRIRALASKYIEGVPVGPFKYSGTRKDDPNDFVPHHHRRELRGLRVIAAWLAHFDTKSGNTFDSYVTEDGRSYVKHYLIDFGSTLGCGAGGPAPRHRGHENDFDPHALAFNVATLGVYVRSYERLEYPPYASVGLFESELFEPQEYKFQSPNPAFENMSDRDGYWGAKIVASFTDEKIRAAVEEGRYSDARSREYLIQTLIERRDAVGRYYFGRVNPLDRFALERAGAGWSLSFDDLAVDAGLETAQATAYRYTLKADGETVVERAPVPAERRIELGGDVARDPNRRQWELSIETSRGDGEWSRPVRVYLERNAAGGPRLVGLRRDT